ncbi:MAG TPA: hypothetical protein VFC94_01980 [Bacteroidaceae bacterium]|nr:hypothetical protein [Bacteroidaceae bacterium]
MKQNCVFFIVGLALLLTISCNSDPNILVDVHEVDFLNKTGDIIEGKLVKSEILGATNIVVFDTLIMITTKNPEGQLQVFSSNTLEHLGSFCKRGRARNEMLQTMSVTEQAYYRNGHLILALIDPPRTFKEVDITASLQSGNTKIISSQECLSMRDGEFMLLGNDYNYRYEYEENAFNNEDITGIPTRYTVYKDGVKRELKFFNTLMDIESEDDKSLPYLGSLYKHPQRNFVVQSFQRMNYLLYMDFDVDKYFAIHQIGSTTFNDTFLDNNPIMQLHFTDGASSSQYLMFLYRQGEYTKKTTAGDCYPELLVFDWEGKYITGFKMDRTINRIEYDEIHKVLYGMNSDEELYAYDMAKIIP